MMNAIKVKTYPETGKYRLLANQNKGYTFFDATDRHEAMKYAIGLIGCMVVDRSGVLTHLPTGDAWDINVSLTLKVPALGDLLSEWNDATNPSIPRTDSEHEECRDRARKAMDQLRSNYTRDLHYRELSNGMLWPVIDPVCSEVN